MSTDVRLGRAGQEIRTSKALRDELEAHHELAAQAALGGAQRHEVPEEHPPRAPHVDAVVDGSPSTAAAPLGLAEHAALLVRDPALERDAEGRLDRASEVADGHDELALGVRLDHDGVVELGEERVRDEVQDDLGDTAESWDGLVCGEAEGKARLAHVPLLLEAPDDGETEGQVAPGQECELVCAERGSVRDRARGEWKGGSETAPGRRGRGRELDCGEQRGGRGGERREDGLHGWSGHEELWRDVVDRRGTGESGLLLTSGCRKSSDWTNAPIKSCLPRDVRRGRHLLLQVRLGGGPRRQNVDSVSLCEGDTAL